MIKVNDLKKIAKSYTIKENTLKLSVSAYGAADNLAKRIIHMACSEAIKQEDPKLEEKHFKHIFVGSNKTNDPIKLIKKAKRKRKKKDE